MSYIITTRQHLQQLIVAARNVQRRIDDGTFNRAFGDGSDDDAHAAVSAFDNLDKAASLVAGEDKIASPFLRYRREIMADTPAGQRLRMLVLNLYAEATPVSLRRIFAYCDAHHIRIALECIVHFAEHGDRDSHFMGLAVEIANECTEVAA